MLIPNHPADERLSALASHDADADSDAALTSHVADCPRCAATLAELRSLAVALAELPDLRPDRPLRLLPPVEREAVAADQLGGWVRRLFAPVMAAGGALALVGLIGTAVPGLGGAQSGAAPFQDAAGEALQEAEPSGGAPAAQGGGDAPAASDGTLAAPIVSDDARAFDTAVDDDGRTGLGQERSPWPMVLFTGVALMIAALLLRWILAPRAG